MFWNCLATLFERFDEIRSTRALVLGDEGDRCTLVARASRASYSVYVVFNVVRTHIIDHQYYVFYIETPSADTGGYHDVESPVFKVLNCELTVRLVHASMQNQAFIPNFQ